MTRPEPEDLGDLIEQLKFAKPFLPFEIVTSRGDRCIIRVPERLIVALGRLVYVDPSTDRVKFMLKNEVVAVKKPRVTF